MEDVHIFTIELFCHLIESHQFAKGLKIIVSSKLHKISQSLFGKCMVMPTIEHLSEGDLMLELST
jgi:hypothetical protein